MSLSFAFTSTSFQKYSWRPCTHSKYETTTPPALASTSGRMRTPRSSRIASAAGVTLVELRHRVADAEERAARRGLDAPERAADGERLAGHDAEHRVALVHRVGVEDPGHRRAVGADVRRGNVLLGPDLVDDLAREAAGHPLPLVARHLLPIADDSAPRPPPPAAHEGAH